MPHLEPKAVASGGLFRVVRMRIGADGSLRYVLRMKSAELSSHRRTWHRADGSDALDAADVLLAPRPL